MRVPVRITVLTMFSVLMIVIVGAVSFSNYRQGEISALETARELIRQSKVSTAENTRRLLGVTSTVANTVTRMPNEMAGATDPFIFADYLRTVIADVPQIYSTFIGFPDGRFVQALNFKLVNGEVRSISGIPPHTASAVRTMEPIESGQNRRQIWRYYDSDNNEISVTESESLTTYDPRERSWFRRALDHGTLGASEVYVFQSLREPGLTISSPMINVAGAVVGIGSSAALVRRLPELPPKVAFGLAARGNAHAGDQYAAAVRRAWWPVLAVAAVRSRAARRILMVSFVAARSPVRAADDLSYSVGVWIGSVRARTIGPLVPRLVSCPGRRGG